MVAIVTGTNECHHETQLYARVCFRFVTFGVQGRVEQGFYLITNLIISSF
jgi:hypothetical protein